MTEQKRASLKHTLAAIVGAVAVVGPQLLNLLGEWKSPKAAMVTSAIGFVVALCLNGKAVALLNVFLPDGSGTSAKPLISPDNKLVGCEIVGWDGKGGDERSTDKGGAKLAALYLLALAAIMAWAAINVVDMARANADQFGGCTADRSVCAGPAVAVTLGQLNLSTGKFGGGVSPGIGYGLVLNPDRWYATGLAFYAAFSVGGGKPNSLDPSLMLSFANYVRLGFAVPFSEREGDGLGHEFVLRFGLGSDFGRSESTR